MSSKISCQVAKLENSRDIPHQIDHAIRQCWISSQPVYIMLPQDVVQTKVEGSRLEAPIDLQEEPNDVIDEDHVVAGVLRCIYSAKKPVILVDILAVRHRVVDEILELLKVSGLPFFVTPMARGAIDETHPRYRGVYAGRGSDTKVRREFDRFDLILSIGALEVCYFSLAKFKAQLLRRSSATLIQLVFPTTYLVINVSISAPEEPRSAFQIIQELA